MLSHTSVGKNSEWIQPVPLLGVAEGKNHVWTSLGSILAGLVENFLSGSFRMLAAKFLVGRELRPLGPSFYQMGAPTAP